MQESNVDRRVIQPKQEEFFMAVKSANVTVKSRSELGSRANKRLRDSGFIPGVIYGHKQSVVHIKEIAVPAGVKVLQDGELIVATVKEILEAAPTAAVEGETAEPEVIGRKAAEGEEGAEGAAPAAGGAAAPKKEAAAPKK